MGIINGTKERILTQADASQGFLVILLLGSDKEKSVMDGGYLCYE